MNCGVVPIPLPSSVARDKGGRVRVRVRGITASPSVPEPPTDRHALASGMALSRIRRLPIVLKMPKIFGKQGIEVATEPPWCCWREKKGEETHYCPILAG